MPFVMLDNEGRKTNFPAQAPNYNPNDTLAQIIVDAWRDHDFADYLKEHPDRAFRERGLYFVSPRVVTVEQYHSEPFGVGEAIFVLPERPDRLPPHGDLLDSARAAMAYTPVGI